MDLVCTFIWIWWCFWNLWWWLRSTTDSYGRLVLEAAYGEIVISLHRGCLGDVSSGWVVEVSTWCITYDLHTWVNTSVGTVYMFLTFNIKFILLCFENLYVVWNDTGGPWHCPSPTMFRECFWPPMIFSLNKRKPTDLLLLLLKRNWDRKSVV